jgi:ribosomal protein S18 acetylase RimI-like enzyme
MYGAILLALAIERCQEARKHVASCALIVDAKVDRAKAFYEHHGFVALTDHPLSLYLALGWRIDA